MATLKEYALETFKAVDVVCGQFGATDPQTAIVEERSRYLTPSVVIGGLLRLLQDKGLATEEELMGLLSELERTSFPEQPVRISYPEDTPPPWPDLGPDEDAPEAGA